MSVDTDTLTITELLEEFTRLYERPKTPILSDDVQAIVVLTADGPAQGEMENFSRAAYAVRLQVRLDTPTPIFWNGVAEESGYGPELLMKLGAPTNLVRFQNCGWRGKANTKTQFEAMGADGRTGSLKSIILVTSSYHIPRVERTAGKLLPESMKFVVLADMEDHNLVNTFPKVAMEIERIMRYTEKGDILTRPR